VHWDDFSQPFSAGVSQPFALPALETMLGAAGVELIRPAQYMDKWRLDRNGVKAVPNTDIKRALHF
jgi:hypothetical protein